MEPSAGSNETRQAFGVMQAGADTAGQAEVMLSVAQNELWFANRHPDTSSRPTVRVPGRR